MRAAIKKKKPGSRRLAFEHFLSVAFLPAGLKKVCSHALRCGLFPWFWAFELSSTKWMGSSTLSREWLFPDLAFSPWMYCCFEVLCSHFGSSLWLKVRRIKFSLYDRVARKDVCSFLGFSPVRRRQSYNCNLKTWDFLVVGPVARRQGSNCNLGTQDFLVVGPVERRQGSNCQSGNSRFFEAGPVGRRQGYYCFFLSGCCMAQRVVVRAVALLSAKTKCDRATTAILELENFGWQIQLEDDRATTAILELENFWVADPVGRRQSYNCNLETWDFWERSSWKTTELQLQSGNLRFFGGRPSWRRQGYNCNLGTRDFWERSSWKTTELQLQSGNLR